MVVYVDDILLMSSTYEEHLTLVSQVLTTLGQHGIKIKPSKCEWFQSEVEFLGHVVSRGGVRKTPAYIEKVDSFPRPTTVRQLREFLGLVNFQRKFIPGCSTLQKPLSALTGGAKKKVLQWTPDMVAAFEGLKDKLREDLLLSFPDYDPEAEKLQLWVDASQTGAGACLTQVQQGELHFIAFNSMTFSGAQVNYSTLDKELAALRWGVKSFQAFLYGTEFVLHTDHQPLVYLHNMRLVDSRLARTLEDLADFNFIIRYVPGQLNSAADSLSRLQRIMKAPDMPQGLSGLPQGLCIQGAPVPGGGNSLFVALLRVLHAMVEEPLPSSPLELREALVDELMANPLKYGVQPSRSLRRDLRLMRYDDQLPSLELLLVASLMFKVRIHVFFWTDEPIIYEVHSDDHDQAFQLVNVYLQCLSGIHFNPLAELKYPPINVTPSCIVSVPQAAVGLAVEEVSVGEPEDDVDQLHLDMLEGIYDCEHKTGNQPTVMVLICSHWFCAVLDTGAELSLVSMAVLKKSGHSLESYRDDVPKIHGITGDFEEVLGFIDLNLDLNSSIQLSISPFAIVLDGVMPWCLLLGADFSIRHSLSIDMGRGICRQSSGATIQFRTATTDNICIGQVFVATLSIYHLCVGPSEAHVHLKVDWDLEGVMAVRGLLTHDSLDRLQGSTNQLRTLKKCLIETTPPRRWPKCLVHFRRYHKKLLLHRGLVVFTTSDVRVPVVTFPLMTEVVLVMHHQMAHVGRDKIVELISHQLWHPSILRVVEDVCTTCCQCQLLKSLPRHIVSPTIKISTSSPFELVAADLVEFGRTVRGNIACLVVVDHNSKWVSAVAIGNKQAKTICEAFHFRICPFLPRIPDKILTDNGPEFTAKLFEDLLDNLGIKHVYSTPYRPAGNGAVERVNRTIGTLLASLTTKQRYWDDYLPQAVQIYNSTMHREIGMSPSRYLLTKSHNIEVSAPLPAVVTKLWKTGHPRFSAFKVGERVIRRVPVQNRCTANKFKPKYDGPYFVTRVNSNEVTYLLQLVSDDSVNIRAHYDQLRLWKDTPKYLLNHPYYKILHPDSHLRKNACQPCLHNFKLSEFAYVSPCESSVSEVSEDECEKLGAEVVPCVDGCVDGQCSVLVQTDWQGMEGLVPIITSPVVSSVPFSLVTPPELSGVVLPNLNETWNMSYINTDSCADPVVNDLPSIEDLPSNDYVPDNFELPVDDLTDNNHLKNSDIPSNDDIPNGSSTLNVDIDDSLTNVEVLGDVNLTIGDLLNDNNTLNDYILNVSTLFGGGTAFDGDEPGVATSFDGGDGVDPIQKLIDEVESDMLYVQARKCKLTAKIDMLRGFFNSYLDSVNLKTRGVSVSVSRPFTRSQGYAVEQPNVQPVILERKKKSRKTSQ